MTKLGDLLNLVIPIIVVLLISLCVAVLVATIMPIALPATVIGSAALIFWLWLRGNVRSDIFSRKRRERRDYPEDNFMP